jgi:hypothetical protein
MEELPAEVFVPGGLWVIGIDPRPDNSADAAHGAITTEYNSEEYLPVFTSARLARGFIEHLLESSVDELEPFTYDNLAHIGKLLDWVSHVRQVANLAFDPDPDNPIFDSHPTGLERDCQSSWDHLWTRR